MSAALVSAQPRWMPAAREVWEHAGLRCAIVASPLGGWNGYVQLPPGHPWRRRAGPIGDLSYGPTAEGWVGFGTLPRLRAEVNDLAEHLATVPPPPPTPVRDLEGDC
jgi:hypothetical protein